MVGALTETGVEVSGVEEVEEGDLVVEEDLEAVLKEMGDPEEDLTGMEVLEVTEVVEEAREVAGDLMILVVEDDQVALEKENLVGGILMTRMGLVEEEEALTPQENLGAERPGEVEVEEVTEEVDQLGVITNLPIFKEVLAVAETHRDSEVALLSAVEGIKPKFLSD